MRTISLDEDPMIRVQIKKGDEIVPFSDEFTGWIDCEVNDVADMILDEINEMMESVGGDSWKIVASDGFGGWENPDDDLEEIEKFVEICRMPEINGRNDVVGVMAANGYYVDLDAVESAIRDRFVGIVNCFRDYAADFLDDIGDIPEFIVHYIDLDRFARDLESDYETYETPSGETVILHA